jgi:hypothetical protein
VTGKKKRAKNPSERDRTRYPIDPTYLERLTPRQRARRLQAGQTVYVRLARYSVEEKRVRHCAGLDLIFQKFTPQQVHDLIKRCGQEYHDRAAEQRRRDAERSADPKVDD